MHLQLSGWRRSRQRSRRHVRQLWRTTYTLLGQGRVPPVDDIGASEFHRYSDNKVTSVRYETAGASPPSYRPGVTSLLHLSSSDLQRLGGCNFTNLCLAWQGQSCALDPLPNYTSEGCLRCCRSVRGVPCCSTDHCRVGHRQFLKSSKKEAYIDHATPQDSRKKLV